MTNRIRDPKVAPAEEDGLAAPVPKAAAKKRETKGIVLPKLDIRVAELTVVGDTELICHNWSAKAVKQMLDKQMGVPDAGREKKDPVADFLATLYPLGETPGDLKGDFNRRTEDLHPDMWLDGGRYGFPAIAFKSAAVEACTSLSDMTKVAARQCFHVVGELVEVFGTPRMREDIVRLQGPSRPPDVRFRAGFKEWRTTIRVRYNARVLSVEQVANLFNTAGFGVGVGEWRSEKDGSFGLFHVE